MDLPDTPERGPSAGTISVDDLQAPASLPEACDRFAALASELGGFERVIVFGRDQGVAAAEARGVPRRRVQAFLNFLRSDESAAIRDEVPDSSPAPLARLHLPGLGGFESPLLLSAVRESPACVAGIVLDAEPGDQRLERIRGRAAPWAALVSVMTELEATRLRAEEMEDGWQATRSIFDALPDPILVIGEGERTILSNRRADELFLARPEESEGRQRAVEINSQHFRAFRAGTVHGEPSHPAELYLLDPADGTDLLFEVRAIPYASPRSGERAVAYVLWDVTDLRVVLTELEAQIKRSQAAEHHARHGSARLDVIVDNAGVPIVVTDRMSNIILMNRQAERLFELRPATSSDSPLLRDIRANDAKLTAFVSHFLLQPQHQTGTQLTLIDPDAAREFPVRVVSRKILDELGEPVSVVSVLHDLTQEVENERLAEQLTRLNEELEQRIVDATRELARRNEELERQRRQLERSSRRKSEFLTIMSHELRTPLNAIMGYDTLLRRGLFGELGDEQAEALTQMRAAAEHLLRLINDILDLSKVEAGKVDLDPGDISLREFVERLSETVHPLVEEKSLEYVLSMPDDLPDLRADETRLRQVLLNLISNAVKFTDDGRVTLRVDVDDGRVRFEIEDTGIGIRAEELEAIFEDFHQAHEFTTRRYGGTGLGLGISRRLIRLMGGELTAESRRGQGSTFRVELPLSPR